VQCGVYEAGVEKVPTPLFGWNQGKKDHSAMLKGSRALLGLKEFVTIYCAVHSTRLWQDFEGWSAAPGTEVHGVAAGQRSIATTKVIQTDSAHLDSRFANLILNDLRVMAERWHRTVSDWLEWGTVVW